MTPEEVATYITENVPIFTNVELIDEGVAYHYTEHADAIQEAGKFLGVGLNKEIDRTQSNFMSQPATEDPGVVFGYENIQGAVQEAYGAVVIEIRFLRAVRALHSQEAALGAPKSVLIVNTDITTFTRILADDLPDIEWDS